MREPPFAPIYGVLEDGDSIVVTFASEEAPDSSGIVGGEIAPIRMVATATMTGEGFQEFASAMQLIARDLQDHRRRE
jgi:hypothetical protein